MLWRGIARYASSCGARYLIGCSSLSSQDENEGVALYEALREEYLVEPALRTQPRVDHRCEATRGFAATPAAEAISRVLGDFRETLRTAGDRPGIQDD